MEFNFQKIVLTIAVVLLILTLVFIGYSLSKAKSKMAWPPLVSKCPDYWEDISGDGTMCVNTQRLGTCNIPTSKNPNGKNLSSGAYIGANSACAKYTWANNCDITWDGVNTGVKNPCYKS